ncbi:Retrovirus-related Pol polyprotein, partial [Mucuna pruriens]
MKPEVALKIKEKVKKQWKVGFLAVAEYPQWVANIVPVPKKDGKVDLNRASPKDNFPLPHIDVLVDNTAQHSCYYFMEGFSGYNQIRMALEDKEKTTFITTWGTFCYKVMPFRLKNAGATYQRAMVTLFHDMMHKEVEVYVDDMISKLQKYRLKLNPAKCTFGVKTGKLLGFIVNERGIKLNLDKVKAIHDMLAPKTEMEVRSFLGSVNYIARFISQLTATYSPLFKLLWKNQKVEWNQECQEAFEKVKQYLESPPVLVLAIPDKPLILYLTVLKESMGGILGQQNDFGKEQAIYYLSKKLMECEQRYSTLERTCCTLVWAAKRLRQYMLAHTTRLIAKMDPLKANSTMTNGSVGIQHRSALVEQLAYHPLDEYHPLLHEFADEYIMVAKKDEQEVESYKWKLWFDGASNLLGNEIRAVLASPKGQYFPFLARLGFDCTNNMAKYEAYAMGITMAIKHQVSRLKVFDDSTLMIYQLHREWETRDAKLVPYHA